MTNEFGWSQSSAGATPPSISPFTGESNAPGQWQVSTGNGTAAFIRIVTDDSAIVPGGGVMRFGCRLKVTNKPTTAQNFRVAFGLAGATNDTPGAAGNHEIQFLINRTDDTTMQVQGRVNDTIAAQTQSLVASQDTEYHVYEVEVNADATSVQFYIDGEPVGTAVTSNIPVTGMCLRVCIEKTAGTTSRNFVMDFAYIRGWFTASRY